MNPLLLAPIINFVGGIIDRVIPNKAAAEKAKLELLTKSTEQEFQLAIEQIRVNIEEAKNPSLFVSGWRPFIGWVCGFGLTYNFLIYPFLLWLLPLLEIHVQIPPLVSDNLMELVVGMLGLAGLRSWEKFKKL